MTASTRSSQSTATIISAEPQLFVSDIARSCRFYVDKLGFEIGFIHGEPPFYAQVYRDGGRLNLRRIAGPVFDRDFRERDHDALSATLTLNDASPLFLELEGKDVDFYQTLKTEPWGAQTLIVQDPDGNLICFAGRAH